MRATVCIGVLLMSCANSSYAWLYNEHLKISNQALINACTGLRDVVGLTDEQHSLLAVLCRDDGALKACYGHMVALAGDLVKAPADLANVTDERYLDKKGLNCNTEDMLVSKQILDKFAGGVMYADLVSKNTGHFQPESQFNWKHYLHEMRYIDPSLENYQKIFSIHAFSMHYLQDSFSAGHNGLARSYLRQDYDQAYHDDINNTGIYLSNWYTEWYTYGDGYYDANAYFIRVGEASTEKIQSVITSIAKMAGEEVNVKTIDRMPFSGGSIFTEELAKALSDDNSKHRLLLSLPIESRNVLSPCFYINSCNKLEIIILSRNDADPVGCDELHREGYGIFSCPIGKNVLEQATNNAELLLLHLIRADSEHIRKVDDEITQRIPSAYAPLGDWVLRSSSINSSPMLLEAKENEYCYKDVYNPRACDHADPPEKTFLNWGITIDYKTNTVPEIDGISANWAIRGPLFAYDGGRFENRYEVINDDHRVLDAFDMAIFCCEKRFVRNVIGIYPKVTSGIDNIWERSERNVFVGVGGGVDMHFGRTIVYLELDNQWYWGTAPLGDGEGIRLIIGVRGAAIDL